MRCDEFDERVHSLLDDRVPIHGDQRLLDHADGCSRCRGMLGTYDDLFVGLKCDETVKLSSDFTQRVVTQVRAGQPQTVRPPRHAQRWFALAAMAIAAGLLIALFPFLRNRLTPNEPIVPRVVEDNRERQSQPPTPDATNDESPLEDAGKLAEGTAVGDPDEENLEQVPNPLDQLAPNIPLNRYLPVDQIRGGLRPITSSLAVAIDALRSTIPIGRHDHTEEPAGHSPSAQHVPPRRISV